MPDNIINIYGQEAWHTEAKIIASKDALVDLKKLIDEAIQYGTAKWSQAHFASDGEGYELKIICLGGWDDKQWNDYLPEYTILQKGYFVSKEVKLR